MASTLRSAASVRTGVSAGGRSGGHASGTTRKTAANTRPVRVLPKLIENNQDVTPKRLLDPEQFYSRVKDSILTHDASSSVSVSSAGFSDEFDRLLICSRAKSPIRVLNLRCSLPPSEFIGARMHRCHFSLRTT